jgi:hypothetical protein
MSTAWGLCGCGSCFLLFDFYVFHSVTRAFYSFLAIFPCPCAMAFGLHVVYISPTHIIPFNQKSQHCMKENEALGKLKDADRKIKDIADLQAHKMNTGKRVHSPTKPMAGGHSTSYTKN